MISMHYSRIRYYLELAKDDTESLDWKDSEARTCHSQLHYCYGTIERSLPFVAAVTELKFTVAEELLYAATRLQ